MTFGGNAVNHRGEAVSRKAIEHAKERQLSVAAYSFLFL
jgi:hypothetical protein